MANKKKILSDYEINYIMSNYSTKSTRRISEHLGINTYHIKKFIDSKNLVVDRKLTRTQRICDYTPSEELFIQNNCKTMSYKEIGNRIGKTECAIYSKVSKMKLPLKSDKWSNEDIEKLIRNYPYYPNSYISRKVLINRTSDSISMKANSLGLIKHGKLRFAKQELKDKLVEFSKELGRTPTTNELDNNRNMPSSNTYLRYFDSYEKACLECGMITNRCLFGDYSSNTLAKDGKTICLSNSELIITNFLIDNNIKFEKEKYYSDIFDCDLGKIRSDWYLVEFDIVVEYFGLHNKASYRVKMDKKLGICRDLNKEIISITSSRITQKLLCKIFNRFI